MVVGERVGDGGGLEVVGEFGVLRVQGVLFVGVGLGVGVGVGVGVEWREGGVDVGVVRVGGEVEVRQGVVGLVLLVDDVVQVLVEGFRVEVIRLLITWVE